MKDLNSVIQEALKEINFEEIAKETAVNKVKEVVREAVNSQLKSYSGFGEQLQEHLKKEMLFDPSAIKLPEYRAFLIGAVNNALASFVTEEHAKEITKFVNSQVVGETRDEIEFSTFWDEVCAKINDECDAEDDEKYTIEFNQKDNSWSTSREYWNLKISVKKDGYSKDKSEVVYAAFSDGKIYHMRGESYELSRVHTWLKALQFRKTKITNPTSEEVSIPNRGGY